MKMEIYISGIPIAISAKNISIIRTHCLIISKKTMLIVISVLTILNNPIIYNFSNSLIIKIIILLKFIID